MNLDEVSILLKKADEYISKAIQKEREKKYNIAKKNYLMASEALLKLAKQSSISLKKERLKKVDILMERAHQLPEPIKLEDKVEKTFASYEKPSITFDDVAGLNEVKEKIRDLIITPFDHKDEAEKWKIKTGGGILLYGPPGTGKTLLAKAAAGEIMADFFHVKANKIMSKWVGQSEKNIADLFLKARMADKSIIFIDEIDALLPKRTGQTSTVMERVVPQFLSEMDGVESKNDNLIFMGATNVPWKLSEATMRGGRFDFKFYISLPDYEARRKIFELNLDVPKENDFDFTILGRLSDGYSGADIALICEEAKREMFKREINGDEDVLRTSFIIGIMKTVQPSVKEKTLKKFELFSNEK